MQLEDHFSIYSEVSFINNVINCRKAFQFIFGNYVYMSSQRKILNTVFGNHNYFTENNAIKGHLWIYEYLNIASNSILSAHIFMVGIHTKIREKNLLCFPYSICGSPNKHVFLCFPSMPSENTTQLSKRKQDLVVRTVSSLPQLLSIGTDWGEKIFTSLDSSLVFWVCITLFPF